MGIHGLMSAWSAHFWRAGMLAMVCIVTLAIPVAAQSQSIPELAAASATAAAAAEAATAAAEELAGKLDELSAPRRAEFAARILEQYGEDGVPDEVVLATLSLLPAEAELTRRVEAAEAEAKAAVEVANNAAAALNAALKLAAPALAAAAIAKGEQPYSWDGVPLTQTYYVRNAATGEYLQRWNRNAYVKPLQPGNDGFVWVLVEGRLFNVESGMVLYYDWGDNGVGLHGTENNSSEKWYYGDGLIQNNGRPIGLRQSGDHPVVAENPTVADNSFVWVMEPAGHRDLGLLHLSSVKAIQTSTGQDAATGALFDGIEFAMEYGPAIASGGASMAKSVAARIGKSTAARVGRTIAKKTLLETIKDVGLASATKQFGKAFLTKAGTGAVKAAKAVRKLATDAVKKKIKEIKGVLSRNLQLLKTITRSPKKIFATRTLKDLSDLYRLTDGLVKDVIDVASMDDEEFEKRLDDALKPFNITVTLIDPRKESDVDAGQTLPKLEIAALRAMAKAQFALNVATAPKFSSDADLCDAYEPLAPFYHQRAVTMGTLSDMSDSSAELITALNTALAVKQERGIGEVYADVLLMNGGFIKRLVGPIIDDTDDNLEIEINGSSVWPNGGNDHRDISKGETKPVGVTFLFDRTKGIDIGLIEYDYASADDDMGHLKFTTDNLQLTESYDQAFIMEKDEGSLYSVDFSIQPLSSKPTAQMAEYNRAQAACDRVAEAERAAQNAVDAFERAERQAEEMRVWRAAILEQDGPEGLLRYDNSVLWNEQLDATCDVNLDLTGAMIAGDWRVGGYNERGEADRTRTWSYSFSEDGYYATDYGRGRWSVKTFNGNDGQAKCGIMLAPLNDKNELIVNGLTTWENYLPVRVIDGELFMFRHRDDIALNSVFEMTVDGFNASRKTLDYAKLDPKLGGPGNWLEKIKGPNENAEESAENIAAAQAAIVGNWSVGRFDQFGTAPQMDGSSLRDWVFTSDHLAIGGPAAVHSGEPLPQDGDPVSGIWKYLGDQRFLITATDGTFPDLDAEIIVNLHQLPWYQKTDASLPGAWQLFGQNPTGKKLLLAKQTQNGVGYYGFSPEVAQVLLRTRRLLGLAVPVDEADTDNESLEQLQAARMLASGDDKDSTVKQLEDRRVLDNIRVNQYALRDLLDPLKCEAGNGLENKDNWLGEWQFGQFDARGKRINRTFGQTALTFAQRGALSGSTEKGPVSGSWTASTGCAAEVSLDAATAALFRLPVDAQLTLRFHANGDKQITVVEPETETMTAWGLQVVDKAIYSYSYANIIFTPAQAANRCSALVQDDERRQRNMPVSVDVTALSYPVSVYRTNYGKRDDKHFAGIDADLLGEVPAGTLVTFDGFKGDEFIVLGKANNCVGVVSTSKATPQRRQDFTNSYNEIETRVINGKPSDFDKPVDGKVVTAVDYGEVLSPNQIANGCTIHRTVNSDHLRWNTPPVTRPLANTGSSPFFVYEVEGVDPADHYSGGYATSSPVFEIAPGDTKQLGSEWGRRYTILDGEDKCVGIVELNDAETYWLEVGDNSTKIQDPTYLTKAQRANGCFDFGKVKSDPMSHWLGGGDRLVSNSGPTDLRAYWVNYDGKYDTAKPTLVIKPGETRALTDFSENYYTVLDSDLKCVAVGKIGMQADPAAWVLGDGSVDMRKAPVARLDDQSAISPPDLNDIQIVNGCDAYGSARSTPKKGSMRSVSFVNQSPAGMILHWASFYGKSQNGEFSRFDGPAAELIGSDSNPSERWRESTRLDLDPGDVVSATDAGGNCVGVFTTSALDGSEVYLRDKTQTDERAQADQESRTNTIGMTAAVADLKKRQAASQCGPDGLLTASSVQGVWKTGSYNARGDKVSTPAPKLWRMSETSSSQSAVILDRDQAGQGSVYRMRPEMHCILRERDDRLTLNVVFNADGTKEFFSANDDGTLAKWGELSPAPTEVIDTDPRANQVDETARLGTPVGITASASDADDAIVYSLEGSELFAVDPGTGIVTVTGTLDRETAARHIVQITATSTDTSTTYSSFTIEIADVNEAAVGVITNAYPYGTVTLFEDAEIGTRVGITAQAEDEDGGDTVSYSLSDSAQGLFAIDAKTGEVSVASSLDWETARSQSIEVTATSADGSSSTRRFIIDYGDANEFDVGPISDADPRPNAVDENLPAGTPVGITASAIDEDGSSVVIYSLRNNDGWFAIDEKTGVVSVASPLDFEVAGRYTIEVKASSADNSDSFATFEIHANDVNESGVEPVIDTDRQRDEVAEAAAIGSPVGVTAAARDADKSDSVSFSLIEDAGGLFAIDPVSGVVSVAGQIDDSAPIRSIELAATSSDGTETRRRIDISVSAVNDFTISAVSDADSAPNTVEENAPAGTAVGITAFASDGDGSDTVTYGIAERFGPFAVDPGTGVVSVAGELDFEAIVTRGLDITVEAFSSDGSISRQQFAIAVDDINEFAIGAVIDDDPASPRIDEDAPVGTTVGITAFAQDQDAADSVRYALSDDAGGLFSIDATTGIVSVAGPLDYEAESWGYTIAITASSSDGSQSPNVANASIVLNDVSEFAVTQPIDIDGSVNEVDENAPRGTLVGVTVNATDADATTNGVYYAITDASGADIGGRQSPFAIDHDGQVTVFDMANLQLNDNGGTTLRVTAFGDDGSTSQQDFEIAVLSQAKWYQNPQGPRVEEDFPAVSPADRDLCIAADEDRTNPATFNNERAYFNCLQRYVPAVVLWRDDPRDIRGDDVSVYAGLPDDQWGACASANDNQDSPDFNNEQAFYDCLDAALKRSTPILSGGPQAQAGLGALVNACAAQHQTYYEPDGDAQAQMTVTNAGTTALSLYAITPPDQAVEDGASRTPLVIVNPGQTAEFSAPRQAGYAVLGSNDNCVGAIKAWESRNSASFEQRDFSAAPNAQLQPVAEDMSLVADARSETDYGAVPQDSAEACDTRFPESPENEKAYYDCMDDALMALSAHPDNATAEPRAIEDYDAVSEDGYLACQDRFGADVTAFFDCMDQALSQPGTADRIATEFPDLSAADIAQCDGYTNGSEDFFWCLGQVRNGSAGTQQQPAGSGDEAAEVARPGADRASVFYQPAYDYCALELGLDDAGAEYANCYYAYPDY